MFPSSLCLQVDVTAKHGASPLDARTHFCTKTQALPDASEPNPSRWDGLLFPSEMAFANTILWVSDKSTWKFQAKMSGSFFSGNPYDHSVDKVASPFLFFNFTWDDTKENSMINHLWDGWLSRQADKHSARPFKIWINIAWGQLNLFLAWGQLNLFLIVRGIYTHLTQSSHSCRRAHDVFEWFTWHCWSWGKENGIEFALQFWPSESLQWVSDDVCGPSELLYTSRTSAILSFNWVSSGVIYTKLV